MTVLRLCGTASKNILFREALRQNEQRPPAVPRAHFASPLFSAAERRRCTPTRTNATCCRGTSFTMTPLSVFRLCIYAHRSIGAITINDSYGDPACDGTVPLTNTRLDASPAGTTEQAPFSPATNTAIPRGARVYRLFRGTGKTSTSRHDLIGVFCVGKVSVRTHTANWNDRCHRRRQHGTRTLLSGSAVRLPSHRTPAVGTNA